MSCLVIKNDGLGDLILASGLITGLARQFNGNLDLVTCEQNREIAEMIAGVRSVFLVSRDELHFSRRLSKLGILYGRGSEADASVIHQIRRERYDVAISLRRFIRQNTLVIMRAVRAENRYCAWQFPTNATHEQATRSSRRWRHYQGPPETLWEPAYYQMFLKDVIGVELDSSPNLAMGNASESTPSRERSVALGISGGSTNWSEDHWIELARELAGKGWRIGLFGGADSVGLATRIGTEIACDNFSGQLSFGETARELRHYEFYIGNDTSLSHFATFLMKKVLVIYGGGTFRRFFPWPMATNQYLIYHGLPCFDCNWICKYPERLCLMKVHPEDVLAYFEAIVKGVAEKERDLNASNQLYSLGWQTGTQGVTASIRTPSGTSGCAGSL